MPKWLKGLAWKASRSGDWRGGSNPPFSAIYKERKDCKVLKVLNYVSKLGLFLILIWLKMLKNEFLNKDCIFSLFLKKGI